MKLTQSDCTRILDYIRDSIGTEWSYHYKPSDLQNYLRKETNPELTDLKCERIIRCVVHNYHKNSQPMSPMGHPISWGQWLREMVDAEPQTYQEQLNETGKD